MNKQKVKSNRSTEYIEYSKDVLWFISEYLDDDHKHVLLIDSDKLGFCGVYVDDEIDGVSSATLVTKVKSFEYFYNPAEKTTRLLLNI